jgi:hypothetical protein
LVIHAQARLRVTVGHTCAGETKIYRWVLGRNGGHAGDAGKCRKRSGAQRDWSDGVYRNLHASRYAESNIDECVNGKLHASRYTESNIDEDITVLVNKREVEYSYNSEKIIHNYIEVIKHKNNNN